MIQTTPNPERRGGELEQYRTAEVWDLETGVVRRYAITEREERDLAARAERMEKLFGQGEDGLWSEEELRAWLAEWLDAPREEWTEEMTYIGLLTRRMRPRPRPMPGGTEDPPPENQAPSAVISYTTGPGRINASAAGSSDPDGAITAWEWALRDASGVQPDRTADTATASFAALPTGTYTLHLRVRDNQGAWSAEASTPPIQITAAAVGDLVNYGTFHSAAFAPLVEAIVGPQVTIGDGNTPTDRNPWPGYDRNATYGAAVLGPNVPHVGPRSSEKGLLGTISLTFGSDRVDGVGTQFLTQVGPNNSVYPERNWTVTVTKGQKAVTVTSADGTAKFLTEAYLNQYLYVRLHDGQGGNFRGIVTSIDSDLQLTVNFDKAIPEAGTYPAVQYGPEKGKTSSIRVARVESDTVLYLKEPWGKADISGVAWSTTRDQVGTNPDTGYFYGYLNYYDQSLTQRILYYRSGDPRYLEWSRIVADAWWSMQPTGPDYGRTTSASGPRPHEAALAGLILRAIDEDEVAGQHGASLKWGWLLRYAVGAHDTWVWSVKDSAESTKGGNRFGGFAHLHVAWLARVFPDHYTDADGVPRTDGAAQRAMLKHRAVRGSVDYYARLQYPDGSWRWWESGTTWTDRRETVFHTGLMLEGQVSTYELVKNDPAVAQSDKDAIRGMILRWADGIYGRAIMRFAPLNGSQRLRAPTYTMYLNEDFNALEPGTVKLISGTPIVTGVGSEFTVSAAWETHPVRFMEPLPGTVTVTEEDTLVTGAGIDFLEQGIEPGDWVVIRHSVHKGHAVRVAEVTSSTLTLSTPYRQKSGAGLTLERYWGDYHPSKVNLTKNGTTMTGTGFTATLSGKSTLFLAREKANGDWQWDETPFTLLSDTEVRLARAWKGDTGPHLMSPTFEGCYEVLRAESDTRLILRQTYRGPSLDNARMLHPRNDMWLINGTGQYAGFRQNNPEMLHALGYAFHITGDAKYLAWGDELFDASFASFHPDYGDGRTCLAYQVTGRGGQEGKSYNQGYRSSGRYLAWRIMTPDLS